MTAIKERLTRQVSVSPLITFRITFGALMLFSTLRFWYSGWIESQYIRPKFYFSYMGFEWVHALGPVYTYVLFLIIGLTALLVMLGLWYRVAIIVFFISFSYVELIDVTNYLNHYYFISIVSFLMIFLPANCALALDVYLRPDTRCSTVPFYTIAIIRLQMGMVYFFAGLAKLNYDWMIEALPMKIWLPAKSHLPVIGFLMYKEWIAYAFSWFGAVYDLSIAFLLINKYSRPYAYLAVIVFHFCTALFFPGIGMFPYVMIISSLIFLDGKFHDRMLSVISGRFGAAPKKALNYGPKHNYMMLGILSVYFLIQLLLPFRYLLYSGPLFWYEEGYRLSWRVMLMEKSGNTFFYLREPATGKTYEVNNQEFLTGQQDKMMSTQPDMILRYAHYLKTVYQQRGLKDAEVFAEGYVALNGMPSRSFINSKIDLSKEELSWKHVSFILPFSK